ncbi:MAG TPA: tetratricopeptide repeat protein, partial [Chloroflexi bacterium]|nr:tetratricopeptide repeat protein [Chloroflexota bacterium]
MADPSLAQQAELTCPQCNRTFEAEIWHIVDLTARPDLAERLKEGTLHRFPCPHCGHAVEVDAPVLVFRPHPTPAAGRGERPFAPTPPLLFSPAQGTTAEQDREQAAALVNALRDRLGDQWRDEWVAQGIPGVPRDLLPLALTEGWEAVQREIEQRTRLSQILEEAGPLGRTLAECLSVRSAEEHKGFLQAHPELYGPEGLALLERLLEAETRPQARQQLQFFLNLHRRCREVGVERAFAEIGTGPPIPPEFQEDLRRAQGGEQQYLQTGDPAALNEAIAAWEHILNHPTFAQADERFRLAAWNDAGGAYLRRYWRQGQIADLDRALSLWQEAVRRTPPDSPDLPGYLNNLGNGLRARYGRTGRLEDLEEAIRVFQEAVRRTPPDSPDLPGYLNNLGNGLSDRYGRTGRLEDLEEAIRVFQEAVRRTPPDSPDLPSRLNNLGTGLRARYARTGRLEDLEEARASYRRACELGSDKAPQEAVRAGRNWGNWAVERREWAEAVEAYGYAMQTVRRLFVAQYRREQKAAWLRE